MNTLGDYIRRRRLDFGLHQKDVATRVNATTSTVTNWEKNRTTPRLYLLPKICQFVGHNPIHVNPTTLGERIKQYRIHKGLSLRKLATELGIDPGTLARWEVCEREPHGKIEKRIDSFQKILNG